MQIFSSWDSVSTKQRLTEDGRFCLEHRLCSQAWQSESFGDKQCKAQSLVRSLCSPRPRLPDHPCCTAVCSLPLLPSRASQLFHSERKSRYGWQDGLLPSHSEQAVYECKMHPVWPPALQPTLPRKFFLPPYSLKQSCIMPFATRHTSSVVCWSYFGNCKLKRKHQK